MDRAERTGHAVPAAASLADLEAVDLDDLDSRRREYFWLL